MVTAHKLLEAWDRDPRGVPEPIAALEVLAELRLGAPAIARAPRGGLGFEVLCRAMEADLLRRFADPVRVHEAEGLRFVCVLDAVVYIHDRKARHVKIGAWQPDGSLAIDTQSRFEIGRPLATFNWLHILESQWCSAWQESAPAIRRATVRGRLRNAARRWIREHINWREQRRVFGEALELDPQVAWMAARLDRNHRKAWLYADRYNAAGQQFERLEWVLADSSALFRLVGLALFEGSLADPDEPVASARHYLGTQGISGAAWRLACRTGPRLFDLAVDHNASANLFGACLGLLRLVEHTDLKLPPKDFLRALFWQYSEHDSERVQFTRNWCSLPPWFLRHAARAAHEAQARDELGLFIDDEFLPAIEWVLEMRPSPDSNQLKAGWSWIMKARTDWYYDKGRHWVGSALRWQTAIGEASFEGFNVFALNSAEAVAEEGSMMRHCAADHIPGCKRGDTRLFSLRDAQTGERVATAMIVPHDAESWCLVQIRGQRNALPTTAAVRAGQWLAREYGPAEARMPRAA